MSLDACAALVARGDPDRYLTVLAAPLAARRILLPIYAFNLEVARAPWVSAEPLIAEMRLQWWRDALHEIASGGSARRHEVVTPLAEVLDAPAATAFDRLIATRRADIERVPFADTAAFEAYIADTGGTLMWVAARALGATEEAPVRAMGTATALAAYLRAIPELEARGRQPLPDGRPGTIRALALDGRAGLAAARRARSAVPKAARPALWAGWQTDAILKQAAQTPDRVAAGTLGMSEARRRATLLWRTTTGMW